MSEFIRKKNILIISEGFEEKPDIDKILSFPNINKDVYNFPPSVNAKGNGNIFARYQYEIQRGFYDIILVFCDVDKGSEHFFSIVHEIGEKFFSSKENGLNVFFFSNPVTLQIVLSHFGDVALTKVSKKANSHIVEELTGIKDYDATQEQIAEMINKIHFSSMDAFKERMSKISKDFNDLPSSNFLLFLERFESDDASWIDEINNLKKIN